MKKKEERWIFIKREGDRQEKKKIGQERGILDEEILRSVETLVRAMKRMKS